MIKLECRQLFIYNADNNNCKNNNNNNYNNSARFIIYDDTKCFNSCNIDHLDKKKCI
jgi:hypothetical protein